MLNYKILKGGVEMRVTLEGAVAVFKRVYDENCHEGDTMKDFYCGITNNLKRRNSEHNVEDVLCSATGGSFADAKELEAKLHEKGFNTGAQLGNGCEDSKIVYMYRKGPNTIQ